MFHTYRITISLPYTVYNNLRRYVEKGKVSRFIAEAVEKELAKIVSDPIEEFMALRAKLPKKDKAEVLKAIKRGRV